MHRTETSSPALEGAKHEKRYIAGASYLLPAASPILDGVVGLHLQLLANRDALLRVRIAGDRRSLEGSVDAAHLAGRGRAISSLLLAGRLFGIPAAILVRRARADGRLSWA